VPIRFPDELPISARVRDIAAAIDAHPLVVVAGETGSGKTTQLPKIALAMGRGLAGRIGVTQPRRIAAQSVAARVAKELEVDLGREVGFQIRFDDRTSPETYVKFMTDGILLAEIQGDPLLRGYDTIILDEAHERSLNVDFLLGYVKRLLPKRPDLRVVVSSATLETARFSEFFGGAPVIEVSGRTYPVEVFHRAPDGEEIDMAEAVADTLEEITALDPREDVLVFLPGEREIRETEHAILQHGLPHTVVLPLYGRLSSGDQARVFQPLPERRVVLATNVAETSLTIPGIVYVIDTGTARVNRHDPRTGVTQLHIEPISKASADQRKGRAGRTRPGVCFRLYDEADFALRPAYTDPEVLRVGLAGVILQMKSLGLGDIDAFPFLDPPPKRAVDEGYRTLEELGAIDDDRKLTDIGKKLARLPLDPRIGRMILAGAEEGALREVLVIAAALGVQDPRERPLAAQQKADEAHRRFRDEGSDFLGLLKLWHAHEQATEGKSQAQRRRFCRDHFLSYLRMREWSDVHQQLARIARELGFRPNDARASDEAVHRALLPGLLSRVGMYNREARAYTGARQTRFQIHPSSGIGKKQPPDWVVAAELVSTSQLFARTVAKIDPAWLEAAGGPLCRKSYGEPTWSERSAEVVVREQVSLFGLPIVKDRKVHFGPIDPGASRRIFLVHALVRGEWTPPRGAKFVEHNQGLFEEVRRLRDKARKSDMLADDDAVARFFEARVPEGVYSGKTFEKWRGAAEAKDPRVLFLSLADVLEGEADELSPERFPDVLSIGGATLPLSYRFEPGEDDDGVTVTVPLALLPALDPGALEHTIPGWQAEKIALLLHSLPRALKKGLGSIPEAARLFAQTIVPFAEPLLPALGKAVLDLGGARVPPEAWNLDDLPPHLRFFFRVVEGNKPVAEGRDLAAIQDRFGRRAREAWSAGAVGSWEREGLVRFSIDAIPETVLATVGGARVTAYPALVDHGTSVSLRALGSRAEADAATRAGLRRLFLLELGGAADRVEKQLPALLVGGALDELAGPAPRRRLAERAIDEAFELADPARFPRTKKAFHERLEAGQRKLPQALAELGGLAREIAVELDRTMHLLRGMVGKPGSPRASLDDVLAQLRSLVTPALLARAPRERMAHVPRYLRGARVRLERLPNGPQKDQQKAALVAPFAKDLATYGEGLRARGVPDDELDAFRWLLEEYRVSVFAPELKTAVSVSPARLTEHWRALADRWG
jgi:ATP-dependent helicase HrpA